MYSNSCCSCSFKPEIIKIGRSSHKTYSNNIVNFQESTTILDACTKKSENLLNLPCMYRKIMKSQDLEFNIDYPQESWYSQYKTRGFLFSFINIFHI